MKYRKAVRRKKIKVKTHEERAVDDLFIEGEGEVTISLADIEDRTVEAFEAVDYGLDSKASKELWENIGTEVSQDINRYLINVCATLDAVKSAEEHIKSTFGTTFDLLDRRTLEQIESSLVFKIKSIILNSLDLSDDEKKLLLVQFTLKGGSTSSSSNPIDAFKKFLSETEREENPYGVGLTRSIKRES